MDIYAKLSMLLGKVIEMSNALHELEIEIEDIIDELDEELDDEDFLEFSDLLDEGEILNDRTINSD